MGHQGRRWRGSNPHAGTRGGASPDEESSLYNRDTLAAPVATRARPYQACVKRVSGPSSKPQWPLPPFLQGAGTLRTLNQQEGEQMITTIFAIISVIAACISAYAAFSLWKR